MKRISQKRRQRLAEAAPFRQELVERVSRCEFCGRHNCGLSVHEISRGSLRNRSQDKPFAVLVVCLECHNELDGKPWALQLALLRRSRPEDYSLTEFHRLVERNYPPAPAVTLWLMRLAFVGEH